MYEHFSSQGFMTARFNFRGVGKSTGRSSFRGAGEMDDVMAVYRYVFSRVQSPKHVLLCGYSYGSMALCAVNSQIPECIGIISISYPAGVLWYLTFGNSGTFLDGLKASPPNLPKLFIIGSKDNFTSVKAFQTFLESVSDPKKSVVIDGADHFWGGLEESLVETVSHWMNRTKVVPPNPKGTPLPPIDKLWEIRSAEREQRELQKAKRATSKDDLTARRSPSPRPDLKAKSVDQLFTPSSKLSERDQLLAPPSKRVDKVRSVEALGKEKKELEVEDIDDSSSATLENLSGLTLDAKAKGKERAIEVVETVESKRSLPPTPPTRKVMGPREMRSTDTLKSASTPSLRQE
ncbi:hypothetical protein HDU76_012769 [Blyttiomyces sp. JEL0837]|nr:hypothetical protein HDU76_012769 [Blyttiomyces sp. JEL0837]